MAVNSSRSQHQSLAEGLTDESYRKVRPDTEVAPGTGGEIMVRSRSALHPYLYDYVTREVPPDQRAIPA